MFLQIILIKKLDLYKKIILKQKVSGSIGKLSDPVKKMDGSESVKKDHDPTRILNILIFPPDGAGLALERPGEAAALLGHNLTQAALCLTFSSKPFQSVLICSEFFFFF